MDIIPRYLPIEEAEQIDFILKIENKAKAIKAAASRAGGEQGASTPQSP